MELESSKDLNKLCQPMIITIQVNFPSVTKSIINSNILIPDDF